MAISLRVSESNNGNTTVEYQYKLTYMLDQLRIAEQRLTTTIDREIDQAYYSRQNAISKNRSIINELNMMKNG